jgi:predicted  nucleic acid-binding Zn-ribbon protein
MKKLSTRRLASVLLAGALIAGGTIAFSASADAAGKQGAACTTLKAKSGNYTCIANPLKTSPKLTWATTNCVAAQADYLSNVANLATYTKNATDTLNKAQSTLASYQNALTAAQAALDDLTNKQVFTITYVPNTRTPATTAVGVTAAIAAYQAKIADDQSRVAFYTAALAKDAAGSNQAKSDQKSIDAFNLGIKTRQGTIDLLNRQLARVQSSVSNYQSQITTWTATVNGAIAQQKQLTAQLTGQTTSAKTTRALACKAGL